MRKADIAVRYGGEEFMLIFPQTVPGSLSAIGEKVRQAVCAQPITLSAGPDSILVTLLSSRQYRRQMER